MMRYRAQRLSLRFSSTSMDLYWLRGHIHDRPRSSGSRIGQQVVKVLSDQGRAVHILLITKTRHPGCATFDAPDLSGASAPGGAGGRGDADGGPLPDAAREVEREALLLLVSPRWRGAQLQLGEEQAAGGRAVPKAKGRGRHRKRRERVSWPGMLLHQDGSTYEWVEDRQWGLIVTMDDVLCEVHERIVGRNNCARFEGLALQLPADRHRAHYALHEG